MVVAGVLALMSTETWHLRRGRPPVRADHAGRAPRHPAGEGRPARCATGGREPCGRRQPSGSGPHPVSTAGSAMRGWVPQHERPDRRPPDARSRACPQVRQAHLASDHRDGSDAATDATTGPLWYRGQARPTKSDGAGEREQAGPTDPTTGRARPPSRPVHGHAPGGRADPPSTTPVPTTEPAVDHDSRVSTRPPSRVASTRSADRPEPPVDERAAGPRHLPSTDSPSTTSPHQRPTHRQRRSASTQIPATGSATPGPTSPAP